MQGKSVEDIRKTFNIINDFTPEQEAQVKKSVLQSKTTPCFLLDTRREQVVRRFLSRWFLSSFAKEAFVRKGFYISYECKTRY